MANSILKETHTFTRADGLRVCHCAAIYSPLLGICPNCHEPPVQPEKPVVYRQYFCGKGYLCTQGGLDGVCCLSCHRFDICKESCNTAELIKKNREKGWRPDQCEHMIEEGTTPTYLVGFENGFKEKTK